MSRSKRRFHKQRIIKKYKNIYLQLFIFDENENADKIKNRAWKWAKLVAGRGSLGCGCVCCANPRRNGWGDKYTWQEKKIAITEREFKDDY